MSPPSGKKKETENNQGKKKKHQNSRYSFSPFDAFLYKCGLFFIYFFVV